MHHSRELNLQGDNAHGHVGKPGAWLPQQPSWWSGCEWTKVSMASSFDLVQVDSLAEVEVSTMSFTAGNEGFFLWFGATRKGLHP